MVKAFLKMTDLLAAILKTLPLFLVVCFLAPVYADPIPAPPPDKAVEPLQYIAEVFLSEAIALIFGAESLFRLWRRRSKEASRFDSYRIMFGAMMISLLVGLVFWWYYGWI
jgi:hypothetical protein